MDVFIEFHGPRRRLIIFGAGHVSHALAALLEPAAMELIVVDDRAEWNTADRFPRARRVRVWDEGAVDGAQGRQARTLR